MIALIVELTVKDEANVPAVRDLLIEQGRLSRAEPGCLRFEVYHSEADGRHFVLCEHWASSSALDAHREAKAFNEVYKPKVLPLVERVPHPSRLL